MAKLVSETDDGTVIHSPSLKQILTYDFHVRKKMMEDLTLLHPWGHALKEASRCPVTRERYFCDTIGSVRSGSSCSSVKITCRGGLRLLLGTLSPKG